MDPFSVVAGVVGLVASIDSIINLLNRVKGLLEKLNQEDYARMVLAVEIYKGLRSVAETKKGISDEQKQVLLLCNQRIYNQLCKLQEVLKGSMFVAKRVREHLDKMDKLVNTVHIMISLSKQPQGGIVDIDYNEDEDRDGMNNSKKVLSTIMDPRNLKPIRKQDLISKNVYSRSMAGLSNYNPQDQDRLVEADDGSVFLVETIPVGTTPKVKASRLNRIGRLILVYQDIAVSELGLVKMEKMIEQDGSYHILSRVEGCHSKSAVTTLEFQIANSFQQLGGLDPGVTNSVLLSLAAAVAELHSCHIVHESISSNNILIVAQQQAASLQVKLAGFLLARIADPLEMSERERSASDPHYELRKKIYQAPERIAGGRYSFECDIYSMGVVMAELKLGKSFLLSNTEVFGSDPAVSHRESILSLLSSRTDDVAACIRDCMANDASNRPFAQEVYDRLI